MLIQLLTDKGQFRLLVGNCIFNSNRCESGCLYLVFVSSGMGSDIGQGLLAALGIEADGKGVVVLQKFTGIAGGMDIDRYDRDTAAIFAPDISQASPADGAAVEVFDVSGGYDGPLSVK